MCQCRDVCSVVNRSLDMTDADARACVFCYGCKDAVVNMLTFGQFVGEYRLHSQRASFFVDQILFSLNSKCIFQMQTSAFRCRVICDRPLTAEVRSKFTHLSVSRSFPLPRSFVLSSVA